MDYLSSPFVGLQTSLNVPPLKKKKMSYQLPLTKLKGLPRQLLKTNKQMWNPSDAAHTSKMPGGPSRSVGAFYALRGGLLICLIRKSRSLIYFRGLYWPQRITVKLFHCVFLQDKPDFTLIRSDCRVEFGSF